MAEISIAATAITGAVGVFGALVGSLTTFFVTVAETRRERWKYRMTRREERQKTYQMAIDLLTDWGWRQEYDLDFDVVRDFTLPFVRTANSVRVYGSPASVAAMDEIQEGFVKRSKASSEAGKAAAETMIGRGHDNFVIAARADVGPRPDDGFADIPFRRGAGPVV